MSKHFRPWKIDQTQLLPPSVQDFVGPDHLARFIVALVREQLDLGQINASYTSSLGQPPFVPRLMVALLLFYFGWSKPAQRALASIVAKSPPPPFIDIITLFCHGDAICHLMAAGGANVGSRPTTCSTRHTRRCPNWAAP